MSQSMQSFSTLAQQSFGFGGREVLVPVSPNRLSPDLSRKTNVWNGWFPKEMNRVIPVPLKKYLGQIIINTWSKMNLTQTAEVLLLEKELTFPLSYHGIFLPKRHRPSEPDGISLEKLKYSLSSTSELLVIPAIVVFKLISPIGYMGPSELIDISEKDAVVKHVVVVQF